MSNVVFILGAGASVDCGGPTMASFLDTASDLLRYGKLSAEQDASFRRVFKLIGDLQVVHSKSQIDLNNIESIFTALEMGKIIKYMPGIKNVKEIDETISALKKLIVVTLEKTIQLKQADPHKRFIAAGTSYEKFAKIIAELVKAQRPTRSASVITFNYDIAIDVALNNNHLMPSYNAGDAPTPRDGFPPVDLLKLHGSLNWAFDKGNKRIVPIHINEYENKVGIQYDSAGIVRAEIGTGIASYFERFHGDSKISPDPIIVPPCWNKADYHQALTEVWHSAAKHLSEAEYIFICGYSLPETDSFFRHLFALGCVGKNQLRCVAVFDPSESVNERFRSMLGPGALSRYEFHAMKFVEAIPAMKNLLEGKKVDSKERRIVNIPH